MKKGSKRTKHEHKGMRHKQIRSSCKHCKEPAHSDSHRFHGIGSFCMSHKNMKNPVVRKTCSRK
jgi:hypothetical protein